MRAVDAKILEELEVFYGDEDCFSPLRDWFGTAEVHWANLGRLFSVAEYAEKHDPSVAEKIDGYSGRIVELFQQTRGLANMWDSQCTEEHGRTEAPEDYAKASNECLEILGRVTAAQEKLRYAVVKYVEFLRSVVSEL